MLNTEVAQNLAAPRRSLLPAAMTREGPRNATVSPSNHCRCHHPNHHDRPRRSRQRARRPGAGPHPARATGTSGGILSLSGYINLNPPVNDIQGCDFVTATELVCASDDGSDSLFTNPFPLLEVTLAAPLTARSR